MLNPLQIKMLCIGSFLVLVTISSTRGASSTDEIHELPIFLPIGVFPGQDVYLCQALQLSEIQEYYVLSYDVQASSNNLHHILLFGCTGENPHANNDYWTCGSMNSHKHSETQIPPPCPQLQLLYAWTRDGPGLVLPPNSSMTIGGDSDIQYLILEGHYKNPDNFDSVSKKQSSGGGGGGDADEPIRQGVILHYTLTPQPKTVGILLISTLGTIEPKSTTCWDVVSAIDEDVNLHPIYFSIHTHSLGTRVSGYRIRRNKWMLIGSKDPQQAQVPYPLTRNMTIRQGDKLAIRCEFRSDRTTVTKAGDRFEDEMCNFYIMYWTERGTDISEKMYYRDPASDPNSEESEFLVSCPNN